MHDREPTWRPPRRVSLPQELGARTRGGGTHHDREVAQPHLLGLHVAVTDAPADAGRQGRCVRGARLAALSGQQAELPERLRVQFLIFQWLADAQALNHHGERRAVARVHQLQWRQGLLHPLEAF